MNCNRCNKEIKNPLSIKHGYGPVCWKIQKGIGVESKKTPKKEQVIKSEGEKAKKIIKRTILL